MAESKYVNKKPIRFRSIEIGWLVWPIHNNIFTAAAAAFVFQSGMCAYGLSHSWNCLGWLILHFALSFGVEHIMSLHLRDCYCINCNGATTIHSHISALHPYTRTQGCLYNNKYQPTLTHFHSKCISFCFMLDYAQRANDSAFSEWGG